MKRDGDPGSCAALAADLAAAARQLRRAADGLGEDEPRARAVAPGPTRRVEAVRTADLMEALAAALDAYVSGIRSPRPPRSGLPHPHTALRSACLRLLEDAPGGGPAPHPR